MVMPLRFEADGVELAMDVYFMVDGSNVAFTMNMPAIEEGISFGAAGETTLNEDGSYFSTVDYVINAPEAYVRIYASGTANLDMTGAFTYAVEVAAEGTEASLSFDVTIEKKEIVDRIATATAQEIYNTPEDIENSSNLVLAAMGLMGDVEKLMSDETVAPLIELFTAVSEEFSTSSSIAIIGGADEDTEIWIEDGKACEGENGSDGNDDPALLSFTLPEFGWLPEGYELSEQYVYADDSDCAYLYFDYTLDDENYYPSINVDFHGMSEAVSSVTYTVAEDGTVQPVTDRMIIAEIDEDMESIYATSQFDGFAAYLYYYGDHITVEDAVNIIANLK